MNYLKNNRYTFGMLINQLDGMYQSPLWQGLVNFAEENNINLVYFVGKTLRSPVKSERLSNCAYDAARSERLDGLIIAASTMGLFCGKEEMEQLIDSYRPLPMVSISYEFKNIPSVKIDSKRGMKKLMEHLIQEHGYRRIAFIKGLEGHVEADDRFEAYLEVLHENGIEFDPELVMPGDFQMASGEKAAYEFLVKKKIPLNAIVAANDEMALGVYQLAKNFNFRIPEDIAITGFDDIGHMKYMFPTFTTVKQPIHELSEKAGEILLGMLEGKKAPPVSTIPAELMIRQSCGCKPSSISNNRVEQFLRKKININVDDKAGWDSVLDSLVFPEQHREYYMTLFQNLMDAFRKDLDNHSETHDFLNLMDIIINQINYENYNDVDINNWKRNFSVLSENILVSLKGHEELLQAQEILYQSKILFGDFLLYKEYNKGKETYSKLWALRDIMRDLSSAITLDKLSLVIEKSFPSIGIKSCFMTVFQPEKDEAYHELPKYSKLIAGYHEHYSFLKSGHEITFPTLQLIPEDILPSYRRAVYFVMPLMRQSEKFGFIIFEMGTREDILYGILSEQISNALSSCKLIGDLEEADIKMKTMLLELQKSEERFKDMAISLPTIIIETGLNCEFLFLNQAGYEIFGIPSEEPLSGHNLLEFVRPEDREIVREDFSKIVYGVLPNLNNIQLTGRDGHEINIISKMSIIKHGGIIERIRWSAIDIKPFMASLFVPDLTFFEKYQFSPREKEIINMMLQGYNRKEIAEIFFISENTVKAHTSSIYSKMNISSKKEFFDIIKNFQVNAIGHSSFKFSILSKLIKE